MIIEWFGETNSPPFLTILHGTTCAGLHLDAVVDHHDTNPGVDYTVPQPGHIYLNFIPYPFHETTVRFTCFFT